jgi:N5-(cytidine 5'-diphosphoramidyl)-L-glutamine hydrolase
MRVVLASQRVVVDPQHGERRDALDQRWSEFLAAAGFMCVALPNNPKIAAAFVEALEPAGVLLTGGGDLASLGGDAPEREASEEIAIAWALAHNRPVYGVCRGFQFLLARAGVKLARVPGHVAVRHALDDGTSVNSFHDWGTTHVPTGWTAIARAADGTLEAARADDAILAGQMWHPEREMPFAARDIQRFAAYFGERA